MGLGGGTFLTQNKVLPGAYMNFVSKATAVAALGERGFVGMALELDWGMEDKIMEITSGDFQKDSLKLFGYSYANEKLKGLRDLFQNAKTLYAYRLNGGGQKATNTYATAKYCGKRGNDIKIVIQKDVDENRLFVVQTYFDTVLVDEQKVESADKLVENDYVTFKNETLDVTAGMNLSGGTNGTSDTAAHQKFLDRMEFYSDVNAIGYVGKDDAVKSLYASFTKRMRDEIGMKFQTVLFGKAADYEGVVNVKNSEELVWWATGVIAGTAVNASASNHVYNGEFEIQTEYTHKQLEDALKEGEWVLHQVGSQKRVLEDINSLVTVTENKGEVFKDNQTVRVCDQIAKDTATLFTTKYEGYVPNDESGRVSLWADIVKHHEQLQSIRAIEGFTDEDIKVEQGRTKKSVVVSDAITVVNAMTKLYMTVTVS